jgi:ethanolamine utilization protein EutP (predicted NTPase)
VYSLNAKQQIFILKTNNRMYYNSIQQPKCDAEIITLWRNAKTNTC